MNWLLPVVRTGFRQQMTFKRAMAIGAGSSIAFAGIRLLALNTLYKGQDEVGGLQYDQVVTWAVLSAMLFAVVWAPWVTDLPESIRQGTFAKDLLRPANPFILQLAQQGGRMMALILVRVLPFLLVSALILPMPAPDGTTGWICLCISCVALITASLAYTYMLGTTAFFTSDYHVWLAFAFYTVQLIGGTYVPVEFFPGIAGDLIRWGPGMAFMASPIRILNDIEPVQTLLIQLFWTVVLCCVAYAGLHLGRKKLVSFGG